jgi:hypothetical protein
MSDQRQSIPDELASELAPRAEIMVGAAQANISAESNLF